MATPAWLKPEDRPGFAHDDPTFSRVELVGYLGQDPEVRYLPTGEPVVTLSLATHRWRRNVHEELIEITDWHRVVAIGGLAEVARTARRGALMKVAGQLHTRSWETDRGERRIRTEVVATEVREIRRGPRARQVALPLTS